MNIKISLVSALAVLSLLGAGCTQSISLNSDSTGGFNFGKKDVQKESDELGIGSKVFAEWKENTWYEGSIDNTCENGFNIYFVDNTTKCASTSEILKNKMLKVEEIKVGTKVIAKWTTKAYYDAEVIKITGDRYTVRYYDKMERDVTLDEMILDTRTAVRGDETEVGQMLKDNFKVGDVVIVEWMTADSLYSAKIQGVCDKGLTVKYYDNAEKCLETSQIILDVPATKDALLVDTEVLVRDTNTSNFYAGKITKIVGANYEVKYKLYGDEVTKTLAITQLRIDSRK
ncbi:MAG: hypothetical protein A2488_01100 [Candidatus Magasanikbacteria bacterium RIFOXYC12_FULL_32_21b]|nr:MAG: hypothetical protein A2488_01100 [Candidatus Magasanikbacteria bacterium RIFOXYC12_FULL_32_21b]OGH91488.1 MAG: hypothetical protein A2507_00785 [Candidatus Magasanikbacteria bacterium RIFOXYD12_FULL_33_17]